MAIEATELMVGDWANIKGKPVKVTLDDLRTMLILFEDVDFHIEPIELTEYILVKNGFEYAYNEASEMQNKQLLVANIGGHYIEVRLDKKNVAIWYDYDENGDGVYSDVLIDLPHHVHKFQHLLRLCGIEKEFVID